MYPRRTIQRIQRIKRWVPMRMLQNAMTSGLVMSVTMGRNSCLTGHKYVSETLNDLFVVELYWLMFEQIENIDCPLKSVLIAKRKKQQKFKLKFRFEAPFRSARSPHSPSTGSWASWTFTTARSEATAGPWPSLSSSGFTPSPSRSPPSSASAPTSRRLLECRKLDHFLLFYIFFH